MFATRPVVSPAPADTSGIWYLNTLSQATGDVRIYAVLGLFCRTMRPTCRVGLIIDSGMSAVMQSFLTDCNVTLHFNDGTVVNRRRTDTTGRITTANYGTYNSPGNLFQFQRDVMAASNVPVGVRELRNLALAVPAVRTGMGLSTPTGGSDALILHVKTKAYIKDTLGGTRNSGINYHEEHKLSYSLALALGKIATFAGWKVFINDDEDRLRQSSLNRSAKAQADARKLLLSAGYSANQVSAMMGGHMKPLDRAGLSLCDQYKAVAQLGTLNVRHVGGRSGHLEFMMYLGQRVYYVEEPNAQGANRISSTLGTLRYRGQILMNRCVMIPTTAGGRAEMEYRYEDYDSELQGWMNRRLFESNPGPMPREDGGLVEARPRINVDGGSVDRYKKKGLLKMVRELGLPSPP